MALFPMVGVVAAYEARRSLWTMTRQSPLIALSMCSMIAVMWIFEQRLAWNIAPSLAIGLFAWSSIFIPLTIARWHREDRAA